MLFLNSSVVLYSFNPGSTLDFPPLTYMSHFMRKPTKCLGKNKGADQLCSNCAFVFATQIVQYLFYFNPKLLACFCDCTDWFVSPKLLVFSYAVSYFVFSEIIQRHSTKMGSNQRRTRGIAFLPSCHSYQLQGLYDVT